MDKKQVVISQPDSDKIERPSLPKIYPVTRADSVNSFASLKGYAQNLLRGDD